MIVARSKEEDDLPTIYTMDTFFLTRLMRSGYDGVKSWTRKMDIFSYDIIFVPVHLISKAKNGRDHWCLAVINLKEKSINFYDSMSSDR